MLGNFFDVGRAAGCRLGPLGTMRISAGLSSRRCSNRAVMRGTLWQVSRDGLIGRPQHGLGRLGAVAS